MIKQYNLSDIHINQYRDAIQHNSTIPNASGNAPYQALRLLYHSYRVQTRYSPYLNLANPTNRDQTRLRTPNDLVTTIIDSHQNQEQ